MIRSKEAHDDKDSLQTVIDGKRPLGYISIINRRFYFPNGNEFTITSGIDEDYFWNKVKENNLKTIKVKDGTYIFYRESAQNDAKELLEIAQTYGGYLHYDATESDTRRIGELLSYDTDDINEFIMNKKN